MHRSNDKDYDTKFNKIFCKELKPNAYFIHDLPYGIEKPSKTGNVFKAIFTLGIASGVSGWGKDYWSTEMAVVVGDSL